MNIQANQTIRDYRVEKLIGKGGFGEVYKAYQRSVQRDVALKVIAPEFANDPEFISRFDAEARIIARLEHAHIVPLYDYWREANAAYLIMRWLPYSLHHLLNGQPLTVPLIVRILDQVGAALNVAHRKGIIHRDIKPDNIMMDEDNNAYLADFGIAKSDGSVFNENVQDDRFGSPAYASPEQRSNGPITLQSDIYSLGIVLHELLTGTHPHSATSNGAAIKDEPLLTPLTSIKRQRPDLPDALDEVLSRATATAAKDRYPTVLAMIGACHDALSITSPVIIVNDSSRTTSIISKLPVLTPSEESGLPLEREEYQTPSTRLLPSTDGDDGRETVMFNSMGSDISLHNTPNPYIGLRCFEESEIDAFFGRDKFVRQLVEQITKHSPFIAIVGPIGSGKSSILHAGLMPALRRVRLPGRWFVTEMDPGYDPLTAMSHALASVAVTPYPDMLADLRADENGLTRVIERIAANDDRIVLVIDHFEEVFGVVEDEAVRAHLLNSLYNALVNDFGHFRLIVSMRADYYDRPLMYKNFGELLHRWTEVVLPLSPDDLEQVIVKPAEKVGVTVEPALVQAIMQDAYLQTGLLALLQYTLSELFEQRTAQVLTVDAYRDMGGIAGALSRRAEAIYTALDNTAQATTQQLFLRLIVPDGTLKFARRRVLRTDLVMTTQSDRILDTVITLFSQSHLLATQVDPGSRVPTVEIVHDILYRSWTRLRNWLEDNRDELRAQQRMTNAAAEWLSADRDASFLASGLRLAQFEAMAASGNVALNAQETAYLQASRALHGSRQNRQPPMSAPRQHNGGDGLRVALVLAFLGLSAVWRGQIARTQQAQYRARHQ